MSEPRFDIIGRDYRRKQKKRAFYELIGNYKHSTPGLNELDTKLASYITARLPAKKRFFIEAGANDGFSQSNTYYLARRYAWRGILIEPIPELATHCQKIRKDSVVVNCALGSRADQGSAIQIHRAGLMSTVEGALGDHDKQRAHLTRAVEIQPGIATGVIDAPVRSLSSIIEEHQPNGHIDLLSLDVEGYEVQALSGLDMSKHRPTFICVEANDPDAISQALDDHYTLVAELSYHDRLYQSKDSLGAD